MEEPQNFPVVSSENNNQIHLNKNTICFSKSSVCEGQSELRLRGVLFLFS